MSSKSTFQIILDKVQQSLSSWKTITLSFAGRVNLAKFVLQAFPMYAMQNIMLPKSICDEVESVCGRFI